MPEHTFNLDAGVLVPGTSFEIKVGTDSPERFLGALQANRAFEADESYSIGKVDLTLSTGQPIQFRVAGIPVNVGFSAGGSLGLAVFNTATSLKNAMALENADELDLNVSGANHYLMFRGSYDLQANVAGTHPIGAVGSISLDAEASRSKVYLVVHRVPAGEGARSALEHAFSSFRVPRHVNQAADLKPGTLVAAEVNGSLALKISAELGMDFSFIRELDGRLTGDIGLHIETGLQIALGFNVSGRYLAVIDRESADEAEERVRLRLYKLRKRGWNFGLDLSVGVIPELDAIPDNVDDLVKATFGVHGKQIIDELNRVQGWLDEIEEWVESPEAFAENASGFISDALADLIEASTGVDPREALDGARTRLNDFLAEGVGFWGGLPERVKNQLWDTAAKSGLGDAEREALLQVLEVLADDDDQAREELVRNLLARTGLATSPIGHWLEAAADQGLAQLLENAGPLQPIAAKTLEILNGSFLEGIQNAVAKHLDLQSVRDVVNAVDYDQLDEWLKVRIAKFLGKAEVPFNQFKKYRDSVEALMGKRNEIYNKAYQALSKRRDFTFAYRYQSTTERTALIDATFDLSDNDARMLLRQVLDSADYDSLLTEQLDSVVLKEGVLTHNISTNSSVEVHMPFYNMNRSNLTEALATVVNTGSQVLFYELDASNEQAVNDRIRGRLSIAAAVDVPLGEEVRVHSAVRGSLAYEYLEAREGMTVREFDNRLGPLVEAYFPNRFPDGNSQFQWISELDVRTNVATGTETTPGVLGDILVSLDLSLPGSVLQPWMLERSEEELTRDSKRLSIVLQAMVKRLLPQYYFQDPKKYFKLNAAKLLLVWASIPPKNDMTLVGDNATPVNNRDLYWDYLDRRLMDAMIELPGTRERLAPLMMEGAARLREIGDSSAEDYVSNGVVHTGRFLSFARDLSADSSLETTFRGLFRFEKRLCNNAKNALKRAAQFNSAAEQSPSKAIAELAKLGAKVTKAFNSGLNSIWGKKALPVFGSMLFLEGARALDEDLEEVSPTALLSLTVLAQDRDYEIAKFLENAYPDAEEVAVEERLVGP